MRRFAILVGMLAILIVVAFLMNTVFHRAPPEEGTPQGALPAALLA